MDRRGDLARRNNFIIRLSDHERDMLKMVAAREQLTASETVRLLVRVAFARIEDAQQPRRATRRSPKPAPKKAKKPSKKKAKRSSR